MNPPGNKISLCGKRVSEAGAGFAAARLLRLLVRLEEPGDFDKVGIQYEPEDSCFLSELNK